MRITIYILVTLCCSLAPRTANADWIVLRGGDSIETVGPWTVDGAQILYTSTWRQYSSIPLTEVDLAVSRAVTRSGGPSVGAPAQAVARPAPPVLRISDGDVPVYVPPTEAQTTSPAPEPGLRSSDELDSRPAETVGAETVKVIEWSSPETASALRIQGLVENQGSGFAAGVALRVSIFGPEGEVLDSRPAVLSAEALQPRGRARFLVDFPDSTDFAEVRFEAGAQPLATTDIEELLMEGARILAGESVAEDRVAGGVVR